MASYGNMLFGGSLTFDHRSQEWGIFKSRFIQYCTANDINDGSDKSGVKRRALLLTALVEDTYRVARDIVFPTPLENEEFKLLLEKLDTHFCEKKSTFAERYQFYKAEQRVGEELPEWAARVRHLAQYCGFKTELDTALRDRFILGLENVKEKEKLFAESIDTLTFNNALEIAQRVRCSRLALQSSRADTGTAHQQQPVYALHTGIGRTGTPAAPVAPAARSRPARTASQNVPCDVCGYKNHSKEKCRYSEYICRRCNKKGHLQRMCKLKVNSCKYLVTVDDNDDVVEGNFDLFSIECIDGQPMRQVVTIDNSDILCEIDSGSAVSVLPDDIYQSYFKNKHNLKSCNVVLNCYNGSKISPLGYVSLPITFERCTKFIKLFVIVTHDNQPALLGRDFISNFKLKLCSTLHDLNHLKNYNIDSFLIKKYEKLFRNELGTFNKYRVHLKIKPDIQLKFFKARPVPLALKHKVEGELQRLSDLGILERVEHSEFATPIVPVLRSDGGIRICGDFSVTLNKALFMDNYPLPRIEDLFAKLHGGLQFSKLDLSRAYNQLELDDSKYLTCINTHKGLFIYNRLVFGLSNAPSIFQRTMEQLLGNIEGTCIFLDDILITGSTKEEHLNRLEQVLWRLQEAGLRLKREKCDLFKDCVEYLGFRIDKNGLHKSESKVNAIINSNCPKNVTELKSFLGMINYYRCFVPNTSSVLSPLHALLKKGTKWTWGKEQNGAFNKIKSELSSDRVLAHYSPEYQTIVTADAGPQGLGAVLAQRQPDGTERVVAYASRSLSNSERNYAQIQKEATSIVFAIKKFHHYLYGRSTPFILRTDHKPLISIFGNKKGVPEMAANRLQRYALFLSAYNFKIEYIKGDNNVADFLSRSVNAMEMFDDKNKLNIDPITYINFIEDSMLKPITVEDIKKRNRFRWNFEESSLLY